MASKEKQSQEFRSLRNIPDSFKKIVITGGTAKPWRNEEGFVIMGMKYFLLNTDSLEFWYTTSALDPVEEYKIYDQFADSIYGGGSVMEK